MSPTYSLSGSYYRRQQWVTCVPGRALQNRMNSTLHSRNLHHFFLYPLSVSRSETYRFIRQMDRTTVISLENGNGSSFGRICRDQAMLELRSRRNGCWCCLFRLALIRLPSGMNAWLGSLANTYFTSKPLRGLSFMNAACGDDRLLYFPALRC